MSKKRDAKVTKLVVWMNFAFLTCWLPYGIIVILSIYGGEGYVQPMYIVIPLLASKSSVCWNPFLYVCMNFQVIYIFLLWIREHSSTLYITHSKDFAGNQGKHQNWDPSILPHNVWLIFMGIKKKIQKGRFFKIAVSQNRQFSKFLCENFMDWSLG